MAEGSFFFAYKKLLLDEFQGLICFWEIQIIRAC
jgi:hypothetical protein